MIVYHGTTHLTARQIKKVGLVPHRSTAFSVTMEDWGGTRFNIRDKGVVGEDQPFIYVTRDRELAIRFAKFRAAYDAATKGTDIDWTDGYNHRALRKEVEGRHKSAKPVVIAFDVDESITAQFRRDPQEPDAQVCLCIITPEHIVEVISIEEK